MRRSKTILVVVRVREPNRSVRVEKNFGMLEVKEKVPRTTAPLIHCEIRILRFFFSETLSIYGLQ